MRPILILVAAIAVAAVCATAHADKTDARGWVAAHFGGGDTDTVPIEPAFSFAFGGAPSAELLQHWAVTRTSTRLDENRIQHTGLYTDPKTNLSVRCVAVEYLDFPAVEWTLYFKNSGGEDSPIIEGVQALDTRFDLKPTEGDPRLFYSLGSHEKPSDFAPVEKTLDAPVHLAPYGGRSSDGVLPFFNLITPGNGGIIVGVGWTGQWAAAFDKTSASTVHVQAGMELTYLRLHPGEEIRTPAILLLFWPGEDSIQGHNLLRRLLLKHYTPTPDAKPVNPPIAASPHGTIAFSDSTEANMVQAITNLASHAFPVDTYWIDAGWNGDAKDWARSVGSWEPNQQRYPHGMKPVADAAHAHGMRFLLWCEPERIMTGTWLYDNHRDWLLRPTGLPPELQYQDKDGFYLLNLGNSDALAWAKDTFSRMIGEIGIDIYRQDFNMTPLYFWRNGEAIDRQGINEIRHVMGLYDFYDTLQREHPGLLIDNCASGGRRIDFEIMRRALSLFRSDYCWEPIGQQGMNYGISFWMPVTGVGAVSMVPYNFRSGMGSHMSLALDYFNQPEMWEPAAAEIRQYKQIRHLFSADYYPLTPYSLDKNKWIAWQYDSPETGEGLVQAFRRDACSEESIRLNLHALNPGAKYTVTDPDRNETTNLSGSELMGQGLAVGVAIAPGAALIHYVIAK